MKGERVKECTVASVEIRNDLTSSSSCSAHPPVNGLGVYRKNKHRRIPAAVILLAFSSRVLLLCLRCLVMKTESLSLSSWLAKCPIKRRNFRSKNNLVCYSEDDDVGGVPVFDVFGIESSLSLSRASNYLATTDRPVWAFLAGLQWMYGRRNELTSLWFIQLGNEFSSTLPRSLSSLDRS